MADRLSNTHPVRVPDREGPDVRLWHDVPLTGQIPTATTVYGVVEFPTPSEPLNLRAPSPEKAIKILALPMERESLLGFLPVGDIHVLGLDPTFRICSTGRDCIDSQGWITL